MMMGGRKAAAVAAWTLVFFAGLTMFWAWYPPPPPFGTIYSMQVSARGTDILDSSKDAHSWVITMQIDRDRHLECAEIREIIRVSAKTESGSWVETGFHSETHAPKTELRRITMTRHFGWANLQPGQRYRFDMRGECLDKTGAQIGSPIIALPVQFVARCEDCEPQQPEE